MSISSVRPVVSAVPRRPVVVKSQATQVARPPAAQAQRSVAKPAPVEKASPEGTAANALKWGAGVLGGLGGGIVGMGLGGVLALAASSSGAGVLATLILPGSILAGAALAGVGAYKFAASRLGN